MRSLPWFLLLAVACRSSQPRDTPPPTTEPAATSGAEDAEAPASPKSAEEKAKERAERAAAALARVPKIKEGLAKLRGLPFHADVPAELQSTADFRAFMRKSIDEELPTDKAESIAVAYEHLGLLETKLDLRKTLEDAMVSQAGAYYDPTAKKFFLVMVPSSDIMLDTISAHELTHALQDQHFDLKRYYDVKDPQVQRYGEDALSARRFIVEGEATLTMLAYVTGEMSNRDALSPELQPAMDLQLNALANMGVDQLKEMSKQQQASSFLDLGDDIRAAIDAMDSVPLILMLPLLESYGRGALPVYAAYKHGGWDEVAKLYQHPPESTEQVLHPDTKLFPTRDLPRVITLPKTPAGFEVVYGETLGELSWRVYFLLWDKESSATASEGWDGDRYVVLRGKDGALVSMIATTWDREEDAQEFEAAYRKSLAKRFGAEDKRPAGTPVLIKRRGADVFIVDGAGAERLLPALEKGAKIK
ncbi:MAG: hypothetical protein R3B48_12890 [Kofleriaceae bacterium]